MKQQGRTGGKAAAAKREPGPRKPAATRGPATAKTAAKRVKATAKTAAKEVAGAGKAAIRKVAAKKAPTAKQAAVPRRRLASAATRAPEILTRLERAYPDAHCALDHRNAFELIVATILSAQCTDKRVNMVTPTLFASYPTAAALADADQTDVERIIQSTGFFRSKAKSLLGMARAVVGQHGGRVPREMEALTKLPGVGRKTANVVLGNAFDINEGIVVDTHVGRVSRRLGLTRHDDPVKVEQDLVTLFPRERWTMLAHYMIEHGRAICEARKPRCGECPLNDLCPSSLV